MKKFLLIVGIGIIVFIASSFILGKEVDPPPDTRIILEHTYSTYIAPPCFETAEATNYLEESTLSSAEELDYEVHSTCTEDALAPENNSLFVGLLKEIGLVATKWDNW